jgi:hypothetical protein
MMLSLSYAAATAAMFAAALYLFLRLWPFLTTSTMLLSSLLLVYGPALLSFTLSSGEYAYLIRPFIGATSIPASKFPTMQEKIGSLDPVIASINFSIALMYSGIMLGLESMIRFFPERAALTQDAMKCWSNARLSDGVSDRVLLVVLAALFAGMLFVSLKENHIQTISHFFAIKGDNTARNLYRAHFGGGTNYIYNVALSGIAPMLVIWGLLAGVRSRSWPLLLAVSLLFSVTMLGKAETLSKAPPAFFILQIMLAFLLIFTNRISWRVLIIAVPLILVVVYITTRLIIVFSPEISPLQTVYSRLFEVENETLVENFAVFPRLHPFMWGANIHPIAALMGAPYTPSFSIVAYTWYHDHNITSPTLFIADAWADFSYAGVFLFSIVAGAICRGIDLVFLPYGKSAVAIAVLSASFWGVLTLITTSLNIALITGGLLIAPLLAAILVMASPRPRFASTEGSRPE